ncbi:MAG: arylsulfatase [Lachnospiraceae bacterium]|nr:arylsulfatase [Lachnospiraceae bacterium]
MNQEKKKPNVLLIMTDEMRGDCLGIAGHPDVKTPYLDTLAAKGIYFPNAYSACPSCVPARASLFTGLSQRHTGRVGYEDGVEWNYGTTLAGELSKGGYYTQCVGKMHVHPLRNYMGFHNVILHDGCLQAYRNAEGPYHENQQNADDYFYWLKNEKGISADVIDTGLQCNSWVARPWIYEEMSHPTNWAVTQSIDFLRRRDRRKPFFLMTSFVRPHAPYDAPEAYFSLYQRMNDRRGLRAPARGDWDDRAYLKENGRIFDSHSGPEDETMIAEQQIGYYACITHIDHQIGRLLQTLEFDGVLEDTVILFTSDHGEMLSDHCLNRKNVPYQGSIRIPMLVYGPEKWIGKGGRRCDEVVELRDVMPTILGLAGLSCDGLDGRDMLERKGREYLHGEHLSDYAGHSNQFIVTKTDKYIWFPKTGREQYFHLASDPEETTDRIGAPECAERIRYLRGCLIKELAGCPEGYSDGERLMVSQEGVPSLPHAREACSR